MGNYAFKRLGNLLLAVSGSQPPLDEEWSRYLALCGQVERELGLDIGKATALIFSDGGSPTSPQRVALSRLMKGRGARTAVVTESLVQRVAMGVMGLVNPGIQVFPPRDWKKAAAFTEVAESQHLDVLKAALVLGREVGDVKVLRAIGL
jgi:hypothetical protein